MSTNAGGIAIDWGVQPCDEVHAWQERLVERRAAGEVPNLLLTGQHPAVITLGRKSKDAVPAVDDVPVVEVERGGEATYHGPGQLVAYPIVHLTEARRDLHRFRRDLEEIGIRVCGDLGLKGGARRGEDGRVVRGRR